MHAPRPILVTSFEPFGGDTMNPSEQVARALHRALQRAVGLVDAHGPLHGGPARRVAGGGVALLYAARVLDGKKGGNHDQQVGIEIVRKALQSPARQIAENAGLEGGVVVEKVKSLKGFGRNRS